MLSVTEIRKMINPAIKRSIEIQEASRKCGIIKPKMTRIVNRITRVYPHYSVDDIADTINEINNDMPVISIKKWEFQDIAEFIIDVITESY
jgi:hypothetical protein